MEFITAASVVAVAAVALVTQWLKYVPATWTTKYAVYINIFLSAVAAVIVKGFPLFTGDWLVYLADWAFIALAAALTYELLIKPAVANPKGNVG